MATTIGGEAVFARAPRRRRADGGGVTVANPGLAAAFEDGTLEDGGPEDSAAGKIGERR
ncbi:hypothetical protein [Nocardia jejuensis]|uniref:hypothetical protein n=1 Tax=Nocardia jejuensis TaxID=328049 RepID=UPI001FDF47B3|nr:hypothetical protein [Nocardia jejuensis]